MLLKKIFSALTVLTLLCALAVGFAAPAAAYTLPEDVRLNARAAAVVFLGGSRCGACAGGFGAPDGGRIHLKAGEGKGA